mgnify:CR=1 FL=1
MSKDPLRTKLCDMLGIEYPVIAFTHCKDVAVAVINAGGFAVLGEAMQPFLNYNFPGGLYLTGSPVVTANWEADSSQRWTVPLGGGIGKIFHLGKLPVNTQLGAYYNVVHPDNGATWSLRLQVQFMFPK